VPSCRGDRQLDRLRVEDAPCGRTYAVSLGFRPRACAQRRKHRIAVEIFPKLAIVTRSR